MEAKRHLTKVQREIRALQGLNQAELVHAAKELGAPVELVAEVQKLSRLPVVTFVVGGVARPPTRHG